uniref:Uncharacterized protein n=1 Tax=Salarias fasciatus TaxID=181472 RepID=A0A672HKL8_SALFA
RTMMAPRVLFLLLQLCSLQVLLVSMTTRCHLTKHLVLSTYRHLEQLGEPFPLHCRSYNQNIYFPDDVVPAAQANRSQCQQVLRVLLESLQEAEPIFMENEFPDGEGRVNWDANKLEGFLIHQNRVLEEGQCVIDSSGVFSSYFRNVTTLIEQQDPCGWEILRRDLSWVLKTNLKRHYRCFK